MYHGGYSCEAQLQICHVYASAVDVRAYDTEVAAVVEVVAVVQNIHRREYHAARPAGWFVEGQDFVVLDAVVDSLRIYGDFRANFRYVVWREELPRLAVARI